MRLNAIVCVSEVLRNFTFFLASSSLALSSNSYPWRTSSFHSLLTNSSPSLIGTFPLFGKQPLTTAGASATFHMPDLYPEPVLAITFHFQVAAVSLVAFHSHSSWHFRQMMKIGRLPRPPRRIRLQLLRQRRRVCVSTLRLDQFPELKAERILPGVLVSSATQGWEP